jgi:ribose 5-phosphate isomerase B
MSYERDEIAARVRKVVSRALADHPARETVNEEVVRALPVGSTYRVARGALVTPLARQVAMERRVRLVEEAPESSAVLEPAARPDALQAGPGRETIALGADHGGYQLKEQLKTLLSEAGYGVMDCGTHSTEAVDYPDYAYAVARLVAEGRAWRGVIVDGAGIGSCMAANKVPGVRAATCYDQATAVNSREHNNANVLTLGAGLIGANLARQIVTTWLATEFAGGRHARRVDKIDAIGRRYAK